MYKKIFKILLALNLCFGTVMSSQGAVTQVSEGSSFITKAEFSTMLNEASERIQILELKTDNKIDEIVNSFLLRNNIWHPTKQTLISASPSMILKPAKFTLSNSTAQKLVNLVDKKACIERISKSGLMILDLYYRASDDGKNPETYRWGYYGNMNQAGNWTSDNGTELTINFYEANSQTTADINNAKLKYACLIGTANGAKLQAGNTNTGYACVFALPYVAVSIPTNFFVTKGKVLLWEAQQLYKFALTSNVNRVCLDENAGQDVNVWIANSVVY